jgi:hypothetical protein
MLIAFAAAGCVMTPQPAISSRYTCWHQVKRLLHLDGCSPSSYPFALSTAQ